jgi:FkbM family methyltransferase
LRRFLRFQIGCRLFPDGVVVPFVGPTRLLLKRGMSGGTGNYYCGLHEHEEMGFLLHLLRETDTFADVGANVGSYTLLASGVCGARTFAFEPCATTFRRLGDNVRLNDLVGRVRLFNVAVGSRHGTVTFSEGLDTTNHVVTERSQEAGLPVPIETLDAAMCRDVPCLVKVDVEGFETEVVMGAGATLASAACQAIIMEIGLGNRYAFDEGALLARIRQYGFHPCNYDPFARRLSHAAGQHTANVLFVKDLAWAEARMRDAPVVCVNGVTF